MLVIGAAIQAGSGAIFWLIAAKLDVEADVGSAAKLSQSILFVTYLAGLGLPVALARYAADRDDDSDTTFTWAVIATSTVSGLLGWATSPSSTPRPPTCSPTGTASSARSCSRPPPWGRRCR